MGTAGTNPGNINPGDNSAEDNGTEGSARGASSENKLTDTADGTAGLERKADRLQGGNKDKAEDLEEKAYGGGDDDDIPDVPLPG